MAGRFGLSLASLTTCLWLISAASAAGAVPPNSSITLQVSHILSRRSPFRPTYCHDDSCIWEFYRRRLLATLEARRAGGRITNFSANAVHRKLRTPQGPVLLNKTLHENGDHYLAMYVGAQQSQQVYLTLDSGSEFMWTQCDQCQPCYPQHLPLFRPQDAGSRFLNEEDDFCNTVQADRHLGVGFNKNECRFKVAYADGNNMFGLVVDDTVWMEDMEDPNSGFCVELDRIGFGCGFYSSEGNNDFLEASGMMGLAFGTGVSFPEQLGAQYGTSFCFCLPSDEEAFGFLVIGPNCIPAEGEEYYITNIIQNVPNQVVNFWYIDVVGIKVAGGFVDFPNGAFNIHDDGLGGTRIDSGQSISTLSSIIYEPLRDAWRRAVERILQTDRYEMDRFDSCYDYRFDEDLPVISFLLRDGTEFSISNVLVFEAGDGYARQMCWPYVEEEGTTITLGAFALQTTRIFIDPMNWQVGWKYYDC